jgi:alkyl sulfatase BDS1-like metallo-beta-lactamase superfamily hydrolase
MDVLSALPTEMIFDLLGVRLNGPHADGKRIVLNWTFTDSDQRFVLNLENSALTYLQGRLATDADASLTLTRSSLTKLLQKAVTFQQAVDTGELLIAGNPKKLVELFGLLDDFEPSFPIVEP